MNLHYLFKFPISILALLTAQVSSLAATPPPASKIAAPRQQTVIYALGASLFYQDLDSPVSREEKLRLPAGVKIEYLSGSQDGIMLAFSAGQNIYTYNTASKILTPIAANNGQKYLYPSISPDGQTVSCRPYSANATLCILSRGGSVRDLGSSTNGATKSHFTPDGQVVYFSNGPDLLRIPVAGGPAERVVRAHYIENFSINAQGLILAAIPYRNESVKPGLINGTGQISQLDFEGDDFYNPTWSPDGTSAAFSRRPRYGGEANAQGIFIWNNIKDKNEIRKISDAQSNSKSGFVWR